MTAVPPGCVPPRRIAVAVAAVVLAVAGIAVAVFGERTGRPWLREAVGPGLTVVGVGVWLLGRRLWR